MGHLKAMGAAIGLFALSLSAPALAVPVLDQEFDPAAQNVAVAIGQVGGIPTQNLDAAQTFTVGITGTLTSVEILVRRDTANILAPLVLDIRTTTGGAPTDPNAGANILGMVSAPAATIGTTAAFVSFDLSGLGISVTAGDVLAIATQSAGANPAYLWTGSSTDDYAAGSAYRRLFSTVWEVPGFANDWAFRTFVEASTLPEPGTLALFGLGLAGLALARHKRAARFSSVAQFDTAA